MSDLTEQLRTACREAITDCNADIEISPAYIAKKAVEVLDPKNTSLIVIRWGCNLQCRQLARELLRKRFDPTESDGAQASQHPLFPDLQERYPTRRVGGPKYVVLEELSESEWRYNIDRMRRAAHGLLAHADSLEAWGLGRFGNESVG